MTPAAVSASPQEQTLPTGFMVVHGNHPEALRDLMLAWIGRHPLAPLENEQVLVQSNGVAQWLKLAIARDASEGGLGVAAALQVQLPSSFIWQAYRAVLGAQAVPLASPFDKPLLVWRLMRLLPELLEEAVFAPLQRFLARDDDLRKRHQLAERLADLFDQYQVYRADWLADWAAGRDVLATSRQGEQAVPPLLAWQPRLWRALLASSGPGAAAGSRAEVHRRFLDAVRAPHAQRPAGLPRRLVVFGISSLPQQSLEVLGALARWCQVLLCVHNPCAHDWSHIIADKDLLRTERHRQRRRPGGEGAIADEALHLHAQPLLAAWGKQGRDFIRLLDAHDERETYERHFTAIGQRVDVFQPNARASVLQQIQDDILDLRPLPETRAHWPAVDASTDTSIRFHVCHGPQREVEVLHDQLVAAFAADPTLRPRDIVVMVPDIALYAPHVQAVFGLLDAGDARHVPFSIADQGQRHHDALLGALEKLLALPESRIAVTDVLDLLDVPALRARFGIAEDDLPLLRRWISAAGIRWGLDAEQRRRLDLPPGLSHNTWTSGLRRMLLGYAVGAGAAWEGIVPMDEIGGLDAALLGPLVRLVDALELHWRQLAEPASPAAWDVRLRDLLQAFFDRADAADGFTLMRLESALQAWLDACAQAGLEDALPLSVVREHWLAQLDQGSLASPFFAGAVTFATLMPMRAIPFRRVALLGMNDGDYPRARVPTDFDLMGQDARPGDRSRREDDRYLFLEALLSAREHLHLSWVGRSIRDNEERPPSVLVAQLRDHVAAGWRLRGDERPQGQAGAALVHAMTVAHRLQPFDPVYFSGPEQPGLSSYAREWRADGAAPARAPDPRAALPAREIDHALTVRRLADFLKAPVRAFFHGRLGVHFDRVDPAARDHEPFGLDALENWQLQDELIQVQRAAVVDGGSRGEALAGRLADMALRGDLPVGSFGAAVQRELAEPMADLFDRHAAALAAWPHPLPDESIDYLAPGAPASLRLEDWLGDLRRNVEGERGRVLLESGSLVRKNRYRRDRLLPFWVAHLAGHLGGDPLTTVIVSKAGTVTLPPLRREVVHACWQALLQAWQAGSTRPLPLAAQTGFAWLEKGGSVRRPPDESAHEAARACYEDSDRERDMPGERDADAYLARAFPDFDALWSDGEFARLADVLLRPAMDAIGEPPKTARGGSQ